MPEPEEMQRWELILPTEENGFSLFAKELEDNPKVLFHATPKRYFDSIANSGFCSAAELGTGELSSVSYAKRSSSCLAHIGNGVKEDYVIFAVEFDSLAQQGIKDNPSDIHVNRKEIQPHILGYCEIPEGFRIS
ncbi:MAG: hypothetical protein ACXV8Q_11930 [Methylobacter sp.]